MMSMYDPVQADIGDQLLTAKAAYADGKRFRVEKDMAEATTIMAVRAAPESATLARSSPTRNPRRPTVECRMTRIKSGRWRRTPLRGGTSALP